MLSVMKNEGKIPILWFAFAVLVVLIGSIVSFVSIKAYLNDSDATQQAWKSYTSRRYGFSIEYPAEVVATDTLQGFFTDFIDSNNRVTFTFPVTDTLASTTGIASGLSFGVSPESTSTCYLITGSQSYFFKTLQQGIYVNKNHVFHMLQIASCAPGDCLTIYQYSLIDNGLCYRADLAIDSGIPLGWNNQVPTPDQVKISDSVEEQVKSRLQSVFLQMIRTFKVND
jgi:hypothetical protein